MSFINHIANRLSNIVIADGKTFQAVFFQNIAVLFDVGIITEGALYVKVVTPASKLESVVAEFRHFLAQLLKW